MSNVHSITQYAIINTEVENHSFYVEAGMYDPETAVIRFNELVNKLCIDDEVLVNIATNKLKRNIKTILKQNKEIITKVVDIDPPPN